MKDKLNLRKKVYSLLTQIPKGKVTTYGALAEALGDKKAARAIGRILNKNPNPARYPCFKVVKGNGRIGGYKFGKEEKIKRLKQEGIEIKGERIKNFDSVLFKGFSCEPVFKDLRKEQREVAEELKLKRTKQEPEKIAGVDVAYKGEEAFAIALLMDKGFKVLEEAKVKTEVRFPYIPTYFYYREGPIIEKVLKRVETNFDLLFSGSNGILHPRGAGLASFIGFEFKKPTIGVAKGLLSGKVRKEDLKKGEASKIFLNGKEVGFSYKPKENTKPIFISPGNLISLEQALKYTREFQGEHKLPEPLYKAHKEAELYRNEFKT